MTDQAHLLWLVSARRRAASGEARALRLEAGLSLREVARAVGAGSPATVFRWESGQRTPRGGPAAAYGQLLDELARSLAHSRTAV